MSKGLSTRIRGVGPVYMAYERACWTTEKTFSRSWIIEMAPPYRVGRGLRIRVKTKALQVGLCRRNPDSDPLTQVGGHALTNDSQSIGAWGRDDQAEAQQEG